MAASKVTYTRLDAPQLETLVTEVIRRHNPNNIGESVSEPRSDGLGGWIFTAESIHGVFHNTAVRIQIKHEESGGSSLIVTPGLNCTDDEADAIRKALEDKIDDILR